MIHYFCLVLLFLSLTGKALSQVIVLDSTQVKRIAATGQLWGHLNYFHPYLSDSDIDWEKAFTDNIQSVITAKNNDEYATAVQNMLARLHDPVTKVIHEADPYVNQDTVNYPIIKFIENNVLYVAVRDYSDLLEWKYTTSRFTGLKSKLLRSSGILFDLRSQTDPGKLRGIVSSYFSGFENSLVGSDIFFPGFKARFHDGFVPEVGWTSGGYSSGHYTMGEKRYSPDPVGFDAPVFFLVSELSEIPRVALALQTAGQAKIISTSPLSDATFITPFNYKLNDSTEVNIRLNELSTDYKFKEDFLIPPGTEEDEIMKMAVQLMKGNTIPQTKKDNNPGDLEENTNVENPGNPRENYPDLPHRLLAAAKIWTVIHYLFAYQDLMNEDWDEVFREYIPRMAMAADALEYNLAIAEMYTYIEDGHGSVKSDVLTDYFGQSYPPMKINFDESRQMNFFNQAIPPPQFPTYEGKTIMLIDERTMSQAEHTGLFFEAANGTKFVGSQTAGANGDVTNFRIPGNIILRFSGHDVRHADGRQLQKIGLVPDVPVKPTIEGIRVGKDEVLDRAIKYAHQLIEQE